MHCIVQGYSTAVRSVVCYFDVLQQILIGCVCAVVSVGCSHGWLCAIGAVRVHSSSGLAVRVQRRQCAFRAAVIGAVRVHSSSDRSSARSEAAVIPERCQKQTQKTGHWRALSDLARRNSVSF